MEEWIGDVCDGLASCIHMLNPPLVVLGGGIMENSIIFNRVRARLMNELLPNFRCADIRPARLGNRAGMLGAAPSGGAKTGQPELIPFVFTAFTVCCYHYLL